MTSQDVSAGLLKSKVMYLPLFILGILALNVFEGVQYVQWDHEKGPVVRRAPSTAAQPQS